MTGLYDTDKELLGYIPVYRDLAAQLGPAARVCEIGVQQGGSLLMWQDLFPQGIVAGVDISLDAHWPAGTIRIAASQDDQTLPGILDTYAPAWDLIVDDASHVGSLTRAAYGLLWPIVAPGGFYVIEDWFIGLPSWNITQTLIPGGHRAPYDPDLLQLVQDLLLRLDRPYPGWEETARQPGWSDVESVSCRYGMVIVRKSDVQAAGGSDD